MKYDAITLDTNIFTENGYRLEDGLLKHLRQFKSTSIKVVFSEVVIREVIRHIEKSYTEKSDKLISALQAANKSKFLSPDTTKKIEELLQRIPSPKQAAQQRLDDFICDIGAEVIKADNIWLDIEKLIDLYFDCEYPFENNEKKKKEFPDAIALLSLERWAGSLHKVLVVTKDKGWLEFIKKSNYLESNEDLAKSLELLQHQIKDSEDKIRSILYNLNSDDFAEDRLKIIEKLSSILTENNIEAESNSYPRSEGEITDIKCIDFSITDVENFTIVEMDNDYDDWITAEIPVLAKIEAHADFMFYIWDSIDKEEIPFGSCPFQCEQEIEISLLVTFSIPKIDPPSIHEIELVDTVDAIDFGDIEPDFSDRED